MPTEEQLRQMQEMRGDQEPVMLQTWLYELKDITSSTDVWSYERAIAKPRPKTSDTKPCKNKTKKNDAAKAA
ncbi:uncharacterized protein B0J16DRAFT_385674 [Fusarium flagelliforme]|uniref:Uncharacterized protein n=1 Tax=Fusarium flagelliforme TaxID=2675880 RepID=A0A395MES2_9HYPO|nr:uncharacterized protein B0J16DRAFT_385674 [Fusarium flagelliforme]KAH7182600.1 hypothetical protein B0J16DRAFT_385674 [Fusarium flagelliforme]RFN45763.1 hypothetical protein FIE12Z_9968 [Fusarium flagelliforme]